jgi:hypothetical protein
LVSLLQILFSSHNTLHDYPDDKGVLSLEGFLQTCTVSQQCCSYQRLATTVRSIHDQLGCAAAAPT